MIRGTTPTLTFTLPFSLDGVKTCWITFAQNGSERFTVDLSNECCEWEGDQITINMTQEQTLKLKSAISVSIQLRVLTNRAEALASDVITVPVKDILKDGVIG